MDIDAESIKRSYSMNAMRIHAWNRHDSVTCEDVARPKPGAGELLVRVCASGVIAAELEWSTTWRTADGQARSSPILGHEFSGIVEQLGDDVANMAPADAVYGLNDW